MYPNIHFQRRFLLFKWGGDGCDGQSNRGNKSWGWLLRNRLGLDGGWWKFGRQVPFLILHFICGEKTSTSVNWLRASGISKTKDHASFSSTKIIKRLQQRMIESRITGNTIRVWERRYMDRGTNGKIRIHTCIPMSVIRLQKLLEGPWKRKNLGFLYRQEGSLEDKKE